VQFLSKVIDDRTGIQDAIDAPRWRASHVDWSVATESRFAPEIVDGLRDRGHEIVKASAFDGGMGHAHAIEVTESGYAAATDPRAEGAALGH
jgi:gamma-glutamyltranspeptidase/glutathione hydrolase